MELEPFRGAVQNAGRIDASHKRVTTGSTAAAIAADLAAMLGSVSTPGPYTWILRPKTLS